MRIYHEAVSGFGYDITPDVVIGLTEKYNEKHDLLGTEDEVDSCLLLFTEVDGGIVTEPPPNEFAVLAYCDYDEPCGWILAVKPEIADAVMRGEQSCPDMNPLIEWANQNGIQLNKQPKFHTKVHSM